MNNDNSKKISELGVIYLHGFASGPNSSKAIYFNKKLAELEVQTQIPDLNFPDFENMTLSTQLRVVDKTVAAFPANKRLVIVGSSMGGLLAALKASEIKNLVGLILLAPGFGLNQRWPILIGEQALESWKNSGSIEVFNYAEGKKVPLSYKFFEDINRYQTDDLVVTIPTIIFHGRSDETVPLYESEKFKARNQDYVQLHTMDDDHQLISSLEDIWMSSKAFLSSL